MHLLQEIGRVQIRPLDECCLFSDSQQSSTVCGYGAVSHSSAESEIMSPDAGLRIEALPALQISDFASWERSLHITMLQETPRVNVPSPF